MDKYLQIRKDECSKAPSSPFLNFKNGQCLLQDVSNMEVPKCRCKRSCNTQYCENLAERRQCKKTCPAIKCQNRWGDCVNEKIYMNVFCVGTPQDGVGISAKLDLKMGLIVGEYVGEYLTREVYQERRSTVYKNKQHFYGIEVESAYIDANKFGNFSKFINHCKTYPNLVTEIWRVDGLPRLYFRTLCDIPKGTELTFDYNMKDFDPQPCRCSTCSPNKSAISFKPPCFKKQPELPLERQSLRSTLKTLVEMESQTGDINAGFIDPSVPVEAATPAAVSDAEESTHSANIAFHVLDENVATSTTTEIKKRKRIVESDGDFYCIIQECTQKFTVEGNLRRHILTAHEQCDKIKCPMCTTTFSRKDTFTRHFIAQHNGHAVPTENKRINVIKAFACAQCSKSYKWNKTLKSHLRKDHGA